MVKKKKTRKIKRTKKKRKVIVNSKKKQSYLEDVSAVYVFWVHDGKVLKNLDELLHALKTMAHDTFVHHVNKERNDFSNWINDIIKDKKLAKELKKVKSKKEAIKKVLGRIKKLKQAAKSK